MMRSDGLPIAIGRPCPARSRRACQTRSPPPRMSSPGRARPPDRRAAATGPVGRCPRPSSTRWPRRSSCSIRGPAGSGRSTAPPPSSSVSAATACSGCGSTSCCRRRRASGWPAVLGALDAHEADGSPVMFEYRPFDGPPTSRRGHAPPGRAARRVARRSSPSAATSTSGSRSRSASSASPSPSTPARPSSTRSSARWARRWWSARGTARSPCPTRPASGCSPTSRSGRTTRSSPQLHDPDGLAPALGSAGGPVELPTRADPDRWVEIATYPVTVGIGLASAGEETIVVMRDVTEARRREAVRETFIGVLSHELRTPVTTIFGGAKLLARETSTLDEATRRGIFQDIYEEAERLQRLVEDVVALNRFGEGAGEIGWEPVLLQRLLPRIVSSEQARWPGVSVRARGRPGACRRSAPTRPTSSRSSATSCRTPPSTAAPAPPSRSAVEPGDGEVVVRVLDDGPGFPPEEATRLFELFYRSPGDRRVGQRCRDRPVRVRPADRRHGWPDLGGVAERGRRGVRVRPDRARRVARSVRRETAMLAGIRGDHSCAPAAHGEDVGPRVPGGIGGRQSLQGGGA